MKNEVPAEYYLQSNVDRQADERSRQSTMYWMTICKKAGASMVSYIAVMMLLVITFPVFSYEPQTEIIDVSPHAAKRDAERSISRGKLFLYSSGGFVCYPKSDSSDQELLKLFPVTSLACGCTHLNFSLERYAYSFNNHMLEYATNTPNIENHFLNTPSNGFYSRVQEIIMDRAGRSPNMRKHRHVK